MLFFISHISIRTQTCTINRDQVTGQSRGFGFVRFGSIADVRDRLALIMCIYIYMYLYTTFFL